MRSINALAFTSAIALLLIATFSVAPVKAAHGELKVRQSTERENIKTWWDRFFQDIKNSEGSEVEVKVVNPTTTVAYTLYPGRKALAATTSSSKTSSRSTSTTRRTTSTSTRRTSTSTKAASTSTKPATTSTKPAATTSKTSSTAAATNTAGLSSFASNILKAHNDARAPRGANALTWSTEAEAAAKAWGDKCVWQHGGASGMGQNLAASAGYKQTGQQVVDAWMSEEKDYNPSNPTYSHFTQVVWKSTTQVGCYQSTCNKLYNPDGSETFPGFSPSYYTVCNYKPPGNYAGQYAANVQKL